MRLGLLPVRDDCKELVALNEVIVIAKRFLSREDEFKNHCTHINILSDLIRKADFLVEVASRDNDLVKLLYPDDYKSVFANLELSNYINKIGSDVYSEEIYYFTRTIKSVCQQFDDIGEAVEFNNKYKAVEDYFLAMEEHRLKWEYKIPKPSKKKKSRRFKRQSELDNDRRELRKKRDAKEDFESLKKDNEIRSAIRKVLLAKGFVLSHESDPLGGVFPKEEWIKNEKEIDLEKESDSLMSKYNILANVIEVHNVKRNSGTKHGLIRMYGDKKNPSKCVCISWFKYNASDEYYVPAIGFSGFINSKFSNEKEALEYFNVIASNLALYHFKFLNRRNYVPVNLNDIVYEGENGRKITKRKQHTNSLFEMMFERTNDAVINYNIRHALNLRKPSKQAMMSFAGFEFWLNKKELSDYIDDKEVLESWNPDISIAFWHSLNCAEPAALAAISSLMGDGYEVDVCFPYEGGGETDHRGLRPKETCPWCASVEVSYRSFVAPEKASDKKDISWTSIITTLSDIEKDTENSLIQNKYLERYSGQRAEKDFEDTAYREEVKKKMHILHTVYEAFGLAH